MSTHDKNPNLPWYVNNSLSAAERQALETQLTQDAELKLEVEFLQQIRQQVKKTPGATPGKLGWQKLQRQINRTPVKTNRRWQGFAIAASLMLMVQGAIIFNLLQTEDNYAPLSGLTQQQPTLQIRFNPDIREADMRQLLRDIQGQILDGPSANNLYRVSLENPEQIAHYIETLRANSLVDHVAQD